MSLSVELLHILACPKCKNGVTLLEDQSALVCAACGLKFPIRDGIPIMLVDEAAKISE
jgi:uncharacterized protein